jgi:hypothetical protein
MCSTSGKVEQEKKKNNVRDFYFISPFAYTAIAMLWYMAAVQVSIVCCQAALTSWIWKITLIAQLISPNVAHTL